MGGKKVQHKKAGNQPNPQPQPNPQIAKNKKDSYSFKKMMIGGMCLLSAVKVSLMLLQMQGSDTAAVLSDLFPKIFGKAPIALTSLPDNLKEWGSFRPGIYFGMKSRVPNHTLSTGLMWAPLTKGKSFRHQTNQDELMFEWLKHDGTNYGIENLLDRQYNIEINASFIISDSEEDPTKDKNDSKPSLTTKKTPVWAQRIMAKTITPQKAQKSLLFYFSVDSLETNKMQRLSVQKHRSADGTFESALSITGYTAASGWFHLFFLLHKSASNTPPTLSYHVLKNQDTLQGTDRVRAEKEKMPSYRGQPPPSGQAGLFDETTGNLMNVVESAEGSFIAIQVSFDAPPPPATGSPVLADVLYFDHIDVSESGTGPLYKMVKTAEEAQLGDLLPYSILAAGVGASNDGLGSTPHLQELSSSTTSPLSSRVDQYLTQLAAHYETRFDSRFQSLFDLRNTGAGSGGEGEIERVSEVYTPHEMAIAKKGLSSVLGGIGYFEGSPRIEAAMDADAEGSSRVSEALTEESQMWISLLSATPSRTSFPRGFLWDEGFHQLLISRWNVPLSLGILSSWLGSMHPGNKREQGVGGTKGRSVSVSDGFKGWIPREMILGDESSRRVPDEFISQRSNIANPPTLLLALDSMIQRLPPLGVGGDEKCSASTGSDKDQSVCASTSSSSSSSSSSSATITRQPLNAEEQAALLSFLRDNYSKLDQWVQWFLTSQRGSSAYPDSFRWRGRSANDGKRVPNTLASGLDDYPRSYLPSALEHHVDLHCWMVKACEIMARIERVLAAHNTPLSAADQARSRTADYNGTHVRLLGRLDALHWSDEYNGYFDVGMHNEKDARFYREMYVRCQNPQTKQIADFGVDMDLLIPQTTKLNPNPCPRSHETLLFIHRDHNNNQDYMMKEKYQVRNAELGHIPRLGYVSIFPLLLMVIDPSSPHLSAVLDLIEDPKLLWTDYGLRSMATTDAFYQKWNSEGDAPYWRGPIWININFLAVSALRHYSVVATDDTVKERAGRLYRALKQNIQSNVLREYANTGFFWEQFDDKTGRGIRGHPFTGWTALFVNIMADML